MFKKRFFLFLFLILSFESLGFAEEVNIIYTGASFSSLYPCGHCPASVGGGLSRRAQVIKDKKKALKNLLILDSGSLFAGSSLDEFKTTLELDKQRTDITLRALEIMGYQAIGVSEDEFSLGLDFLKEKIRESKVPFISSNLKIEGIKPFLIKEFGSLRVGITGLSSKRIERFGVEVLDYSSALKEVLSLFKSRRVEFVILLSSLTLKETQKIVKDFEGIDLVIFNRPYPEKIKKIRNTHLLYPYYQAKKLGQVKIYLEKGKIKECEAEKLSLALTIKEDRRIKSILPACFKDSDCPKREGLVSICEKPGRDSQCIYLEMKPLRVKLITKFDCKACSTELAERLLKNIFRAVEFEKMDYKTKEAQRLIKKLSLKTLPAFIFDTSLVERKEFNKLKGIFEDRGSSYYLLKPKFSGIFYYLERPFIDKRIDLFIDLYQKDARGLLEKITSLAEKKKYFLKLHFILKEKKKSIEEEYLRTLAVRELYPQKFWEYLLHRLLDIESSFWNLVLEDLDIDVKKISNFALSEKAKKLLDENLSLAEELGVNTSGVILLNNKEIFLISSGEGEVLEEFLD